MAGRNDSDSLVADVQRLTDENKKLRHAILDIDAHATGMGEDKDGWVEGGYLISIGSLHRALGVVGHTARKCEACPHPHDVQRRQDALQIARDFIAHHPAVSGEWPVVLGVIDRAMGAE